MSNENWGVEIGRKPSLPENAAEIFSEPGRIIREGKSDGCDYRSHWIVVYKREFGEICLKVKHCGGEETFPLGWQASALIDAFRSLSPDQRYEALYTVYKLARESAAQAARQMCQTYAKAFLEKRLKRRQRDKRVYVDILPETKTTLERLTA